MDFKSKIPAGSLLFAPMEGITDEPYRMCIQEAFSEWSYLCTDFLRLPNQGHYSDTKMINHFGQHAYNNPKHRKKTGFQILTTATAQTSYHVQKINELGFDHLDINLGCPSRKVNAHKGGSYLLSELSALKEIINNIRENFNGVFSAKIRVGYKDDSKFFDILRLLEDSGVEAITIHGRTRDQMYDGLANWDYIKEAVRSVNIPIIGNGDCWSVFDVENMFDHTDCHAIMLGRGALKTPWLATIYEDNRDRLHNVNDDYLLFERARYLDYYFFLLERNYRKYIELADEKLLKRFKAYSRYLFDDYPNPELVRSRFLRSRTLEEFKENLTKLSIH